MTLPSKTAPRHARELTAAQAGFTLLEMLVVIAVMALILVLVTQFGPPRSHRLEAQATAQNIANTMRMARGRAIAQGQPVKLVLPAVPDWLSVTVQSPAGGISFAPDGSASGGRVRLHGDGQDLIVSADWLTGRVRIDGN
jgi:general secretion pathway protein H